MFAEKVRASVKTTIPTIHMYLPLFDQQKCNFARLSNCIAALQYWFGEKILNSDKWDAHFFGTRPGLRKPDLPLSICFAGCPIAASERIKLYLASRSTRCRPSTTTSRRYSDNVSAAVAVSIEALVFIVIGGSCSEGCEFDSHYRPSKISEIEFSACNVVSVLRDVK